MAELALGIGTAHTPLLTFDAELWQSYSRRDLTSTRMNLSDGRWVSYQELLAERGAKHADVATLEHFKAKAAACQAALDRVADDLLAASPDVVIIVTDDHSELFHHSNMPAVSIFYGEDVITMPRANVAHLRGDVQKDFFEPMAAAYAMDKSRRFPGCPSFARELIERMVDKNVDMGAAANVEDPSKAGLGHGVGFVIQRLFRERPIPVIPLLLNTYYPPNAPTSARCYDIGRALGEAIEESPTKLRVALVASGGLSHFVVDEELDRRVVEGMSEGRGELLRTLPRGALNAGSSEIRCWILVAGAIQRLRKRWLEYQPLYRTPAGTGIGVAFGVWEPK
jgi:hypothetical protein